MAVRPLIFESAERSWSDSAKAKKIAWWQSANELSIRRLKEEHDLTHPAKAEKSSDEIEGDENESELEPDPTV